MALLTPLPETRPLDRLRAEGEVSLAAGDLADLWPPLSLARGQTIPSVVLARLRADERPTIRNIHTEVKDK